MSNQAFQTLKDLPTPLDQAQCVLHKHELLICGGYQKRACYSYHTLKNEYKFICEYPSDVELWGHCVLKLINDESTLLSFGGSKDMKRHTLVMKYVSVWSNDKSENKMNKSKESKKSKKCNEWVPFTDSHKDPIIIGRDNDDYRGVRAVIGGNNNNLLFITCFYNNISVFDLNTFQFIKHDTLPTNDSICYHCFTGLSIEYDEDNNTFQFHQIPVCDDIAPFNGYAYVCIDNVILFFGGLNAGLPADDILKSMHKYSIRENKWTTFQNALPSPLSDCVAILSEDSTYVHIIGGWGNEVKSTHTKTE
ncbi:hypothetical protein RFI_04126, partial [Reticulomyxa filosa]